ncbi:Diguanylate cyclase (GGDEF)-like protein [Paraburkholderia unamae]|uniref:putative bifunctional diguanylate cyclase/phosphodiesterase n=1 Tax=Paraburkholderia unamae TaxID=219649 RepID=UPI001CB342B6|nr:EAL domain-containing protein [Paraburkholderia unamae]CAG9266834.1 Diguanylate cyclase (GGDEF)-like protein [Paraburkholderia unamae]
MTPETAAALPWYGRVPAALRASIRARTKLYIGLFFALFAMQTTLLAGQLIAFDHAFERVEATLGKTSDTFVNEAPRARATPPELAAGPLHARAGRARLRVRHTIEAAFAIAFATLAFGLALLRHLERTLLRPLQTLTDSLVRLAHGEDMRALPNMRRTDEIGAMAHAFATLCETSHELKIAHEATRAAEAHAQALARHDPLTGLPNRRLLAAEMSAALERTQLRSPDYLVFVIDLDRFKPVNDLHGHAAGDTVLCEIAVRLRRVVRDGDTVARLGGDEFAVLARVHRDDHVEAASELAQRLLAATRAPIDIGKVRINVDASIGIACCPRDGGDPDALLRAADIAMYRAKCEGKGTYRFFEQKMDDELRLQATLETDLRRALAGGEIRPFYQPLVRLADGQTTGFEILARWHHDQRGWIPPDVFVPLIEQMGISPAFTASILRRACRDALCWPARYHLALNLSPAQFKDTQLAALLLTILADEGMPPERLEIEITESALMGDFDIARAVLEDFRRAGLRMSLDDFGTGYSSLQHLRELKVDKLKIDRSFVLSMTSCNESAKIVDAIIALSSSLGMTTVAEGVETAELARTLAAKGCDYAQGYFFGKAMAAREIDALLDVDRAANEARLQCLVRPR